MQVRDLMGLTSPKLKAFCQGEDGTPTLAILPLGATEQHGPHLPLGTDTLILEGLIAAARPVIESEPGAGRVLILPTQSIGLSPEHQAFAGTLDLGASVALEAWYNLLQPLPGWGVERVLLVNGHGGQVALCELLGQRLRSTLGMTAIWCHVDALGEPAGAVSSQERRIGLHGGLIETALMLALHPDLVDMDQAQDFGPQRETVTQGNEQLRSGGAARHAWQAEDLNSHGVVGRAIDADASLGRKLLDYRAKALAQIVKEALTFQLNPLLKRGDS